MSDKTSGELAYEAHHRAMGWSLGRYDDERAGWEAAAKAAVIAELAEARDATQRTGQRWLDAEAEAAHLRAENHRLNAAFASNSSDPALAANESYRAENDLFREANAQLRAGMELLNARLRLFDEALAQVAKHVDNPDSPQLRIVAKIARRARSTAEPEPQP